MLRKFLLIALLLTATCTYAQENENKAWAGYGVEASYVGGKIFRHTKKFKAPVPSYSSAIDINLLQQTYGTKEWQQRRHYPLVGLGITYTDYGLDSVYGSCIGVYPILQLPLVRGKKLEWTLRVGLGVGYATRRFERVPSFDTINNAVGSHINNFTMFATDLRYKLNEQWAFSLGANFSHISDGTWRLPNLGVNMYGAHLALRYFPVTSEPKRIVRDLQPLSRRWLFQARVGFSANEYGAPDGPIYPIYIGSVFTSKRYASRNKAFAGIDYSYHRSLWAFMRNNEVHPGEENKHAWKSAVFVGNEFLYGRFGLVLQLGFYVKNAANAEHKMYQKLGYNFYLVQNEQAALKELTLYAMLKTHKTQAEFIELGMGFGL